MNRFNAQSLTPEKVAALRTLSDELYPLLRDAELAKFMANDLLDGYFGGDEPDGSPECAERLMVGYGRAQTQMQILLDYVHVLKTALETLERVASEDETPASSSVEDNLLGLLTDAASTGKVSSKELGQLLRSLTGIEQNGSRQQAEICAKGA